MESNPSASDTQLTFERSMYLFQILISGIFLTSLPGVVYDRYESQQMAPSLCIPLSRTQTNLLVNVYISTV